MGFFTGSLLGKTPLAGVAVLVIVVSGMLVDTIRADNDNFYGNVTRFDDVISKVHQNYVEKIDSKALIDSAINGMMSNLDPHTTYFEEKAFEELRIHTEGRFGGLGIQISIRDNVLTVMTPIEGTPASRAGIQSGDQIIEIEGKSTKGIKLDDAVGKLRGEPGTFVAILIRRKGEDKPIAYKLTREIIEIKSVPFAGVFNDSIGYARLTQFSENSGQELEQALRNLIKKNVKAIILDLRFNPGGLLPTAIDVAAKFLPRKSLVVFTRGRAPGQNKEYSVDAMPVVPASAPLVVLVNAGSASASEIVAGAVQDWDRGVILGDTTFGKGSVQSIFPLNDKAYHLKLTTAFYYTPSGRCINKPENAVRTARSNIDDEEGDSAAAGETGPGDSAAALRDTTVYHTKNNRVVHGGGGIIPDTVILPPAPDHLISALFRNDAFFRFANNEYPRLQKRKVKIDATMKIDDDIVKAFRAFLDSTKFQFKTYAGVVFDDFKTRIGIIDTGDTAAKRRAAINNEAQLTSADLASVRSASEQIEKVLKRQMDFEFAGQDAKIRKYIREALLVREIGQDNETVYKYLLDDDTQFKAALELLTVRSAYARLLKPASPKN
jgi:carboxyl-terminal processing protease